MKIKITIKVTLLAAALLVSSSGQAQLGRESGGGKGVVCRDPLNQIKSVELLDLWEARTLYKETPATRSSDVAVGVDEALHALQNAYPTKESLKSTDNQGRETLLCQDQDCTYRDLKMTADLFLNPEPWLAHKIHHLRATTLTLTDDSYEVSRPADCNIEQIVIFQMGGDIYLNQDLFDRLDNLNQIALIAHESFYNFLRNRDRESNSIRTRRAIGYVMSGKRFSFTGQVIPKNKYVHCYNDSDHDHSTDVWFYWGFNEFIGRDAVLQWYRSVNGARLMGTKSPTIGETTILNDLSHLVRCDEPQSGSMLLPFADGPIEFDRTIEVNLSCDAEKKLTVNLKSRAPGSSEVTIPLRCEESN